MDNSGFPPEEFIKEVLFRHYNEKKSVEELAKLYGISVTVIKRIIKQYEVLKEKPIKFIEDKSNKKKDINELKDSARKGTEKITEDDIKDLKIDLGLFEKGKEPGEEK